MREDIVPKMNTETLYLEALPKAVRRAVKAPAAPGMVPHGFSDVEIRASVPADGEHGKTTLTYTHAHDATTHAVLQRALVAQAGRELSSLLADDEEDQ